MEFTRHNILFTGEVKGEFELYNIYLFLEWYTTKWPWPQCLQILFLLFPPKMWQGIVIIVAFLVAHWGGYWAWWYWDRNSRTSCYTNPRQDKVGTVTCGREHG